MSLGGKSRCRGLPSQRIGSRGDRLKVKRIDTGPVRAIEASDTIRVSVVAQVIHFKIVSDRSIDVLVKPAVGYDLFVVNREPRIALDLVVVGNKTACPNDSVVEPLVCEGQMSDEPFDGWQAMQAS
jgi:hypothetical protein